VPVPNSYDYAVIRVVPRVERGEFLNVGAVLFCRTLRYLEARIELDPARLLAVAPAIDVAAVERHLAAIPLLCAGGTRTGPFAAMTISERFHWLVAPRSGVVQTSPVHCGLCTDPALALERLLETLVRPPR